MLIRQVLASRHTCRLFFPDKRGLQAIDHSSLTRLGWFRLSPIDQYSSLLPPYHRNFKSRAMRLSSIMGC